MVRFPMDVIYLELTDLHPLGVGVVKHVKLVRSRMAPSMIEASKKQLLNDPNYTDLV